MPRPSCSLGELMTNADEPTFGRRLRARRERAGKTRAVLGGLVGKSEEWVKAVENGTILMPRLPMLLRLADVLGVKDLADLTGQQSLPVESITKVSHESADLVAGAMSQSLPSLRDEPSMPALTARVDQCWHLWHQSTAERTAVAALLPGLLVDARATARALDGTARRAALAELARVYHLAQLYWAHQPASEYVWLAADRALLAAQDADNPAAIGSAVWYYAHVYRGAGRSDQAEATALEALDALDPAAGPEQRTRWGMLHLAIALGAAKQGRAGDAERHLDLAGEAASALGPAAMHPWLMFGTPTVDAYTVTIQTDLFRAGEAIRRANRFDPTTIPSQTRRAGYLIEAARAYSLRRQEVAVVTLLGKAAKTSIDTARHSPYLRGAVLDLADRRGPVREEARELALAVGLLG